MKISIKYFSFPFTRFYIVQHKSYYEYIMEPKIPILIIFLVVLVNTTVAEYQNFKCEDSPLECPGNFSCVNGKIPVVWCDPDDCAGCMVRCAKECGDLTNCSFSGIYGEDVVSECSNCCQGTTCSKYMPDSKEFEACRKACESKCEFYTEFCNIITLFQALSIGIGVVLVTLHGAQWIVTTDEMGRDSAKKGILYVIVGMLIIMSALGIINMLYFGEIIC